jgi:uracil-DNA glycosylase family 4
MPNWINGVGPTSAKLVVCGEAPGKVEDEQGLPFVGPSGELVNSMLSNAGTSRNDCYITNVCKVRPPDNDWMRLKETGHTYEEFVSILRKEIEVIAPNCILALGGRALEALTPFKGIVHYRGSILEGINRIKVVPSIHPANLLEHRRDGMFTWKDKAYIQLDFNRAVQQSRFPELRLPQRSLWVCTNSSTLYDFIERNRDKWESGCAIDFEAYHCIPICIGLSFSRYEGISVPLFNTPTKKGKQYNISNLELVTIWSIVAEFLANPNIKKIGQNLKYDQRIAENVGFRIAGIKSDTQLKFHQCYAEFRKRLEFQTSVLTEEPYYKDEYREFDPEKDSMEQVYLYNAKDASVTKELDEIEEDEIEEFGVRKVYYNFSMRLHQFYYDMESNGFTVDQARRKELIEKYERKIKEEQEILDKLCNHPINVNSNKDVPMLIYVELKIPLRVKKRKSGRSTPSTDEDTLLSLLANVVKDEKRRDIIGRILQIRGYYKVLGTNLGVPKYAEKTKGKRFYEDEDGRIRTTFLITGTESNRTSTNKLKPPVRDGQGGLSYQTITKHTEEGQDIRSMLCASPGYTLIEWDQSQAESRIALHLANEHEMLKRMDKEDLHLIRASWITGRTYEEELAIYSNGNDYYRQVGKHSGHANDNAVGKRKLVELIFHHSRIIISEWKAGEILTVMYRNSPGIEDVFHAQIRNCILSDRMLIDPHRRKRTFYNKLGDELYKEAYAHIKQSTVTGQTQKAGLSIRAQCPSVRMICEWHDALVAECPDSELDYVVPIGVNAFEQPIDFSNCSLPRGPLVIPCGVKVSKNWRDLVRWRSKSDSIGP